MEQSTSEVSRTEIFIKFWKMWIGQVMDLSDPTLLVLDLFSLRKCPSPGLLPSSLQCWKLASSHSLEILLNVKHITRKFNSSKELSKVIIHTLMIDLGSYGQAIYP